MMMRTWLFVLLLMLVMANSRVVVAEDEEEEDDNVDMAQEDDEEEDAEDPDHDCAGGSCPTIAWDDDDDDDALLGETFDPLLGETAPSECGLWLGPSPIKEVEEHGFGLGMFTGRAIPKGASVELSFYGAEPVIPIFDSSSLHNDHPPLREYVWDGDNMPEIPYDIRSGTSYLFIPGAAAIVPCTSQNFNMVYTGKGQMEPTSTARHDVVLDHGGIHRSKDPTVGSFTYRHNASYTAVRDIVPGEELTVECSDDDFDGGAYYLSRFHSNDNAVTCLDNNLRVADSTMPKVGRGLFAKRKMDAGTVMTSTPLIPMHRDDVVVDNVEKRNVPSKQLLLNYCFGHPNSDLLLLPFGPLANYFNHPPMNRVANAEIRWHANPIADNANDKLPRRQQHHHPELLDLPATTVAKTHGKGLMMDIVALRDVQPNEEVFLDYGPDWSKAWKEHVQSYNMGQDANYVSPSDYERINEDQDEIRTATEQRDNPYPDNLQTACFFDEPSDRKNKDVTLDSVRWDADTTNHACLRPCQIVHRYQGDGSLYYRAKMVTDKIDDPILAGCELTHAYIVTGVPQHAIRILDRPYAADMFLPHAFRHEIGVPDGFYPETWMKKRVRRQEPQLNDGDQFKRKRVS